MASTLTTAPASAGFFDLFFQRPAAAPSDFYAPPGALLPSLNVNGRRKKAATSVKRAAKPAAISKAAAESAPRDAAQVLSVNRAMASVAQRHGHLVVFQIDPTLVHGDVVVTEQGLHVFTGRRASVHKADDFTTLAKSSLAKRTDLASIQKVGLYDRTPPRVKLAFTEVVALQASTGNGFVDDSKVRKKGGFKVVQSPVMR